MQTWGRINISSNMYTLGVRHVTWLWLPKVPCCIAATIVRPHVFGPAITKARFKYLTTVSCEPQNDWDITQAVDHARIKSNLT